HRGDRPTAAGDLVARKSAGGTPATIALDKAGVAYALHPYVHDPQSSHFGEEAAAALGVDRDRILKTLVADAGGELVVAIMPVARQLDLKALAAAVGPSGRRWPAPWSPRGPPATWSAAFPARPAGPAAHLLDASAERFETIFISAGKWGLQVELAPRDIVRLTDALVCTIGA
ncbi:MAG TPA: YbaK/EbsC family protein, partial [Propionibacteriaceae bacterium]|nr:YbaK/EbsC family protein [Propionibacteriaceae bacterium]